MGHAIRALRRAPGFATAAVLTLALGIGLATAVSTVADVLLVRPFPMRDAGRLVVVQGATRDGRMNDFPLLLADARLFAARTRALERAAFFSRGGAHPTVFAAGGGVVRLRRALVSGDYFDVLGARAALGRALRPDDDVVGAAPVVVLSHQAWQRHFGGDADVVGRRLVLHATGATHTMVGVMPPGLDFPVGADAWAPVLPNAGPLGDDPHYAELLVVGRLAGRATPADAAAELTAFFTRPGAAAWMRETRGNARSLRDAVIGDVRPAALAFAAAAGLLLLITCVNVANLLLVRGLAREGEVAIRAALGASRARVAVGLLAEGAALAVIGGVLGTAVAALLVRVFVAVAPAGTPRLDALHLDARALAAAAAVTTLAALLSCIAPAVLTSRVGVGDALRQGARGGARRGVRRGTESLVVGQVALALMVLSAAAVVARSFLALERVDLALRPERLLVAEIALSGGRPGDTGRARALVDALMTRVAAIPGVRSVSPVLAAPFAAGGIEGALAAEGQSAEDARRNPTLVMEIVTPSWFTTLGVPVLRGRALTDADRAGAMPVVVLGASAAQHYWPGADPVGRRLTSGGRGAPLTVVGVVPDVRYRDLREARPAVYFPLAQSTFPVVPTTLLVRADDRAGTAVGDLVPSIRRALGEVDAGAALASATPFETLLRAPRAQPRLDALLLAAFAGAAVLLAAVGLSAVVATAARGRRRELGVRVALGATVLGAAGLVLRRGLALAAAGTALGLLGALVANRLLHALLFETSPTDAPTLAAAALGLLGVAGIASLIPAWRSGRVEPAEVLRGD